MTACACSSCSACLYRLADKMDLIIKRAEADGRCPAAIVDGLREGRRIIAEMAKEASS